MKKAEVAYALVKENERKVTESWVKESTEGHARQQRRWHEGQKTKKKSTRVDMTTTKMEKKHKKTHKKAQKEMIQFLIIVIVKCV